MVFNRTPEFRGLCDHRLPPPGAGDQAERRGPGRVSGRPRSCATPPGCAVFRREVVSTPSSPLPPPTPRVWVSRGGTGTSRFSGGGTVHLWLREQGESWPARGSHRGAKGREPTPGRGFLGRAPSSPVLGWGGHLSPLPDQPAVSCPQTPQAPPRGLRTARPGGSSSTSRAGPTWPRTSGCSGPATG